MSTITITATCGWHSQPRTKTVEVRKSALQNYFNGELVQVAFPDLTPDEREVVIDQRMPGAYMCQDCWDGRAEEADDQ